VSDGPLTPWAFVLFLCFVVGLFGRILWRVLCSSTFPPTPRR
jgi:hypothetical protein